MTARDCYIRATSFPGVGDHPRFGTPVDPRLVDGGLPLRQDWEHVVTPVVDAALTIDAFEHRRAAAIADPGQIDDALTGPKDSSQFLDADGAGRHGEALNRSMANRQIVDWLDGTLAARRSR